MGSVPEHIVLNVDDTFVRVSNVNRFREVEWKRCYSETGESERLITKIRPIIAKVEAFTAYDLPQYLFRVWSDNSAGFNCENGEMVFRSQAAKVGLGATRFDLMTDAAIEYNLKAHMRWKTMVDGKPLLSHWISCGSSILFAFKHAYRRHLMGEKNVKIAVIDTYKLKKPTRLFSSFPLIRAYNITEHEVKDSAYSEYVVYDEIEAEMDVISFSELLYVKQESLVHKDPGLMEMCPHFYYSKADLKRAKAKKFRLPLKSDIRKYRDKLYPDGLAFEIRGHSRSIRTMKSSKYLPSRGSTYAGPFSMSERILEDFYRLVLPFKPVFRLPILVSILSMRTQNWEQKSMEQMVIRKFKDNATLKGFTFYHTGYISAMLPELRMQQEMMENVCLGLGVQVVKGSKRPSRAMLNPGITAYTPNETNYLPDEDEIGCLHGPKSNNDIPDGATGSDDNDGVIEHASIDRRGAR